MTRRLLLVALLLPACKKPTPPTTHPDDPVSNPTPDTDDPAKAAADPDAPPDCKPPAVVWDGTHEGCLYEVSGCCYEGPEAACEAAGCKDDCQILESAPAQIACP